ncbi:MAG: protein kinase, partial [Gemmatimonadales bacterium]
GLIHRDIKPANIMLERETGRAIVLDFGVSAARQSAEHRPGPRITQEGVTLGTPIYMSPEQAAAEPVTDRSDVYSLGIVMFELATGRAPFEERTPIAIAAAHLHKIPPTIGSIRPDLEPEFAGLIDRCLAKRPEDRPDAATISRALVTTTSHLIEWPPPGLARLHGTGRRTLTRFRLATAAAFAYVMMLAWLGTSVAGPGWLLLSAGIVALALGFNLGAKRANGRMLRWLSAGRQAGYPLRILLDVALDPPADGAALISGSGIFALVPAPARGRWMWRRRGAATAEAAGLVLSGVTVVLWAFGAINTGAGTAFSILTIGGVVTLFSPSLIAQAIALALSWPELRIRLATGRRPENLISRWRTPVIRRDLAEGWLIEAGESILPARSPWRARALRTMTSTWTLPAIGLALVLVALTWSSAFNFAPIRAGDLAAWEGWQLSAGPERLTRRPWLNVVATVDTLLTDWGNAAADTVAARQMLMDAYGQQRGTRTPWANLRNPADSVAVDAAWTTLPGVLSGALIARLTNDTVGFGPGLAAFRQMAHSPLRGTWYRRTGIPTFDEQNPLFASGATFRLVADYALRDAAAGALLLNQRNYLLAKERARELVGVARPMLQAPSEEVRTAGFRLTALAGRMLARIGRSNGDPALAARGVALGTESIRGGLATFPLTSASMAAAAPDSAMWLRIAGDRRLSPASRWLSLQAVVQGSCWNQREIFSGATNARFGLLGAMRAQVSDLPDADPIYQTIRQRLRQLDDPWLSVMGSDSTVVPAPRLVRWAFKIVARPAFCDIARREYARPVQ